MSGKEMDIIEALKKYIPDEIIDGSNVEKVAEMVDLDVAYKLLVVERPVPDEEFQLFHDPPAVTSNIKKRPDGQYQIDWTGPQGPDFEIIDEGEAKVMRARFLLLKGFYSTNFDKLTLPKQKEVAAQYDIHWIPPKGLLEKP